MSAVTPRPFNLIVRSIDLTNSAAASSQLSSSTQSYQQIQQASSTLINSSEFQQTLSKLDPKQRHLIRLDIQDNHLKIINSSNNEVLYDNQATQAVPKEWLEATTKINSISKTTLTSTTENTIPASSSTAQTSKPLELHPIKNPQYYCFANSAYQLLGNIPSLRKTVLEALPSNLDALKDYRQVNDGKQLVESWNKANPTSLFDTATGNTATDFLGRLVGSANSYPTTPLHTISTRKDGSMIEKEAPSHFIGFNAPPERTDAPFDFTTGIKNGLITNNNSTTLRDTDVVHSQCYFTESPKQLFMQISRRDNNDLTEHTQHRRPVSNIPDILNTQTIIGAGVSPSNLELKGFIVHSGTGRGSVGGHYISYIKQQDANTPEGYAWYRADDNTIRKVTKQEMLADLQYATDLYYDNELTPTAIAAKNQQQVELIDKCLYYLQDEDEYETQKPLGDKITYSHFLEKTLSKTIPEEKQQEIKEAIGKELYSQSSYLTQLSLAARSYASIGEQYILDNPNTPLLKQTLQKALKDYKAQLQTSTI